MMLKFARSIFVCARKGPSQNFDHVERDSWEHQRESEIYYLSCLSLDEILFALILLLIYYLMQESGLMDSSISNSNLF